MNIDAKYVDKEFNYSYHLADSQAVVECDIAMSERGGVAKVLTVTGDVVATKVDCFVGEAKIYGKVNYTVIYLDAENALKSIEYCSDFVSSVKSVNIAGDSMLTTTLNITDIDHVVKGDSIRLQAVVDINVYQVEGQSHAVLTDVDGALTCKQKLNTSVHICHVNEIIDISDSYDTGANVDAILSCDTSVTMGNVRANKDSIIVSGEGMASIKYLSDGKVYTKNMTFPYSDEINLLGVDTTSIADICCKVSDSKIVLAGYENDNSIRVTLSVKVEGDMYEYESVDAVCDAYSCDAELDIERENLTYKRLIYLDNYNERIDGETHIDEANAGIKKLIMTEVMPYYMANVRVDDGVVGVDLLANVSIIYVNEDDEYCVIDMEMPATMNIPCEGVERDDEVSISLAMCNATARVMRERDVNITLDVSVMVRAVRDTEINLISSIEQSGEKANVHKAISVYFVAPLDNMWDIVKNTGVAEDVILAQNPNIDFDNLRGGERVIVCRSPEK